MFLKNVTLCRLIITHLPERSFKRMHKTDIHRKLLGHFVSTFWKCVKTKNETCSSLFLFKAELNWFQLLPSRSSIKNPGPSTGQHKSDTGLHWCWRTRFDRVVDALLPRWKQWFSLSRDLRFGTVAFTVLWQFGEVTKLEDYTKQGSIEYWSCALRAHFTNIVVKSCRIVLKVVFAILWLRLSENYSEK